MSDSDLELYSIVGKMFREIRDSKDLSLENVANYLKIAPKTLQRYECGERKIKMGTIKELCAFYKIDYDEFIVNAKILFGKNIYSVIERKEECPKILQYYEMLNDIGKHEATKRVEELTRLSEYAKDDLEAVAAHHDEDVREADITPEMRQEEEDFLDNME